MTSVNALQEAILENLKTRKCKAGHRMPTERSFSVESGLSRSTVRRVLAGLKEQGLITQTVGSGTYVSANVTKALAGFSENIKPQPASPAELMSPDWRLSPRSSTW